MILNWIEQAFMMLAIMMGGQTSDPNVEVHYSSVFAQEYKDGSRDKSMGGKSPCLKRLVKASDNIIAHRTLPCGTKLRVTNVRTGKSILTVVGERGPYGACTAEDWSPIDPDNWLKGNKCPSGKWVVKTKDTKPGVWRGAFDLTPYVQKKIGHNGFELVMVEVLHVEEPEEIPNS